MNNTCQAPQNPPESQNRLAPPLTHPLEKGPLTHFQGISALFSNFRGKAQYLCRHLHCITKVNPFKLCPFCALFSGGGIFTTKKSETEIFQFYNQMYHFLQCSHIFFSSSHCDDKKKKKMKQHTDILEGMHINTVCVCKPASLLEIPLLFLNVFRCYV